LNPAGGDTSFYEVGKNYFIDISLVTSSGGPLANDFSDAPFSIVAAGFGLNDLTNQLADISQAVSKLIEKVTNLIGR